MKYKTYEEFTCQCDLKKCPKFLRYNPKTCVKEYRRKQCFNSYQRSEEKKKQKFNNKVEQEKDFIRDVWIRLAGFYNNTSEVDIETGKRLCSIWNILTNKEKDFILKNYSNNFYSNIRNIDICHIGDRSTNPDKKYNIENVYLGSRYFHSLLTIFKHPVTRESITRDQVHSWNLAAKRKNRTIVQE